MSLDLINLPKDLTARWFLNPIRHYFVINTRDESSGAGKFSVIVQSLKDSYSKAAGTLL